MKFGIFTVFSVVLLLISFMNNIALGQRFVDFSDMNKCLIWLWKPLLFFSLPEPVMENKINGKRKLELHCKLQVIERYYHTE
jgi:hypothetical protein